MRFRFADHVLDAARRELLRGGKPVALEPQVFDLLVYLIRHRDRVVTKDDLLDSVWGGRTVSESTLTSRINAARKAVGDSGAAQRLIRTVPRKGFRFVAELTEAPGAPPGSRVPYDRPSIAVLPFQNIGGDRKQEYFADGIVEEIITGLSRIHSIYVIARNSSFAYKGKSQDVRLIGRELGARYILEGSVRKSASRVRITGQLIDATVRAHLWANRFEGALADIFELQDQVTIGVVGAIEPKIRVAEIERALRKPTDNLEAYDLVLRARWTHESARKDQLEEAARLYRRAIVLDPSYALAYALLARTLWEIIACQWIEPSEDEMADCVSLARSAVQLGLADPEVLCIAAHIIALPGGAVAEGIAIIDRALEQNPNSPDVLVASGMLRSYSGDTVVAFGHLKEANRLSPLGVRITFKAFAFLVASFVDGDYVGVLDWTAQSLREQSSNVVALRYRTAALGLLAHLDEARQTVNRLLAVNPAMTISRCRRHIEIEMKNPFKRPGIVEAYYEGLRLAGLPE